MWTLDKLSIPDWTKEFRTKREAVAELRTKHICGDCLKGIDGIMDSSVEGGVKYEKRDRAPRLHSADDILATPCGLEYEIYESSKGPERRFVQVKPDLE